MLKNFILKMLQTHFNFLVSFSLFGHSHLTHLTPSHRSYCLPHCTEHFSKEKNYQFFPGLQRAEV